MSITRRTILTGGAMLSAAQTVRARGANERVTLALIGCGNRRKQLIPAFLDRGANIAAVCDVNHPRLEMGQKLVEGYVGRHSDPYTDYRKILERKDIDAVVIATVEHWKCLIAINACQAGKDVYVEKPLAYRIGEGRLMVEAARKHDRIVMIGTQQRSMESYRQAIEYIHSGKLGKIGEVRAWNCENAAPEGYGNPPDSPPPKNLDWDMWLGPAPKKQYNPNRYGAFHFFWDHGGGWATAWGVHVEDIVHWAMKVDKPQAVFASGGRYARNDNTETPDTFEAVFEYPSSPVSEGATKSEVVSPPYEGGAKGGFICVYTLRHCNARPIEGVSYGNAFYGDNGTLVVNREGWRVIPEPLEPNAPGAEKRWRTAPLQMPGSPVEGPHQGKFLEAVRDHKQPEMADVEMGHLTTIPCHLSNISFRTGRKIYWDAEKEQIKNDPEANAFIAPREYRAPWSFKT